MNITPKTTETVPDGRTNRHASYKFKGGGGKFLNPGPTNKYTKFCQLIIRKFIKIIATICHILRLRFSQFDSRRLSVRPSLRWRLTLSKSIARLEYGIQSHNATASVERQKNRLQVTAYNAVASIMQSSTSANDTN